MTLNDLAAAIVLLEPGDSEEMGQVLEGLRAIEKSEKDAVKREAKEACAIVESLLASECANPEEKLETLNQMIQKLQSLDEEEEAPKEPVEEDAAFENDPELLAEFVTESLEHIEASESHLLSLEVNPDDMEALNAVFRAFHTVKGTSGFLNFNALQKLAHWAENLLDRGRNREIQIIGGYSDLALESVDMIKEMITNIQENLDNPKITPPEKYQDLLARLENPESFGISSQSLDAAEPKTPNARLGEILVENLNAPKKEVEAAIEADTSDAPVGEKLIKAGVVKTKEVAQALRIQKKAAEPAEKKAVAADETVRVSTNRLDNLINMVGELVIINAMIAQDKMIQDESSQTLTRNMSQLGKITRELQDLSISMRMVPLKATFSKMTRLVRDLSRKAGKKIKFITEGEDTDIDRNMVESLNDPLVHMIRNSVDHGVETPEQRVAAGKEPEGRITLRAYHAAGNVVIELQDTGKGLDRDVILNKAIEKGIVEPDKELPDSEVFKLIFAPGFSTAAKITNISGRGVGMDVVKKNIEAMRGRVEVTSVKGQGTTFIIRIPLTLAIIDGMLLKVANEHYIVPTLNVNQAFRPKPDAISTVQGKGEMVKLRGALIPLYRLYEIFGAAGAVTDISDAIVIVIEHEGRRCAIVVDQLLGQQQFVIKSIGKGIGKVDGISGGAILGDGRVGLILDVNGLIRLAKT